MTTQDDHLKALENWAKLYFFHSLTDFFNYLKHSELSLLQAYAVTYIYFKGPIKISDLYEHMVVSPAAATQMVDRLEKLGMVERVADPSDRRVRKVVMLEKGKKFVEDQFVMSQNWLTEIPADISPEQMENIATVLTSLIQSSENSETK